MPGFLRSKPTLEEMEQESENLDAKLSVEEKKMLLKKIKDQYGEGGWKLFANKGGGIKSGIDWQAVKFKLGNK